eukprot:TRINITY_DN34945_c0_g1_i1.p1 TRINITY_DN34945_c0_g1~~TRINITY_DN34945_c0_g1_i1.p1  ORF type:complete len:395 (-),score=83.46 TRINITY_DN34945_c0_g1_i1:113-1297(-)
MPLDPAATWSDVRAHEEGSELPPPPSDRDDQSDDESPPLPPPSPTGQFVFAMDDDDDDDGDEDDGEVDDDEGDEDASPTGARKDDDEAAVPAAVPMSPGAVAVSSGSGSPLPMGSAGRGASSSSSPGAGLLQAMEEAQAATVTHTSAASEGSPLAPSLGSRPHEAYAAEEARLDSEFQRYAFEKLKEWDDEVDNRFTARQAVNLVRALSARREQEVPKQTCFQQLSGGCAALSWAVLAALIFLLPLTLAGALARDVRVESSGLVVRNADGSQAAALMATQRKSLQELLVLPEAELRKIRDCSFAHYGAFYRLSIVSLMRSATSDEVRLGSPDGSSLKLVRGFDTEPLAVTFTRPFVGSQKVDLRDPFNEQTSEAGCSFRAMTDVLHRSTPRSER